MKITTRQAAEIIGCSSRTIKNLVDNNKLQDLNSAKKGRHAYIFDSKQVREYAKSVKMNGKARRISNNSNNQPIQSVPRILTEINRKLDLLINMWS